MDELADLDALCTRLAGSSLLRDREVVQLAPSDPAPIDLSAALAAALAKPVGTPPLHELARGRGTAVVITSDATRATPSDALIGPVMTELARAGISSDDVEVVIGVGAHRPATPEEIRRLLGDQWATRLRVTNHDARAADLVAIGRTSRGTPLLVNRRVAQAGLRIAFGQVEPHEFAGFTGGRKAILPSVAGYESIICNHALDMLSAPTARPGILEGNPIHDEMLAAARLARLDFIVNVALDRDSRPIAVAAGDVDQAHLQLVGFLRRHFGVPALTRPPAVIVTAPGRPLDINLYQAVKALVGIEPLLDATNGGAAAPVVVLLARCWDGGGSEEMFEPFLQARERLENETANALPGAEALSRAVLACLEDDYTIEKDESYFMARLTPKCRAVIACCPGVADERLRLLGWEPAADTDAAVARALELSGGTTGAAGAGATGGGAAGAGRGHDSHDDGSRLVVVCPRAQRALFA
jgi:nickel-dependent lactate racemase